MLLLLTAWKCFNTLKSIITILYFCAAKAPHQICKNMYRRKLLRLQYVFLVLGKSHLFFVSSRMQVKSYLFFVSSRMNEGASGLVSTRTSSRRLDRSNLRILFPIQSQTYSIWESLSMSMDTNSESAKLKQNNHICSSTFKEGLF